MSDKDETRRFEPVSRVRSEHFGNSACLPASPLLSTAARQHQARAAGAQRDGIAALIELANATAGTQPLAAVPQAPNSSPKKLAATARRLLYFAAGGGSIAALGIAILTVLVRMGVAPLAAQAVQLMLTLLMNFLYSYLITWRDRPRDRLLRQAGWFLLTRGITQLASWAGFAALVRSGMGYEVANAICLATAMAVNFVTSDKFVFRARVTIKGIRDHEQSFNRWNRNSVGHVNGGNSSVCARSPADMATGQVTPGALKDRYSIPTITFRRNEARGLVVSSLLISAWIAWHLGWEPLALIACASPSIAFRTASWVISWFDRPATIRNDVTSRRVKRLRVTVAVPVYNEDPGLLDRCLWALVNQSRRPELVWVVDDGSQTDYTVLRRHWEGSWPLGTEVRWTRQENQGKRRAHAYVFESDPDADIFVTVDSDTTLEYHAIEEGLKPFQSRGVMSVAGIEMGFNAYHNFLTRLQCSLQLFAQAVIGAAWSYAGDMYTNRGPFALYRASVIREFLSVYRNETFFGRRMILGDDSLLALCASARGRSVQQLTAYGLTMWPENLSHHLRQRIRWARGRAVRNFWRTKYRPIMSYCWWFTVSGIYDFLYSSCLVVLLIAGWPSSAPVLIRLGIAFALLSVPNSLRTLCFHRSDETFLDRLALMFIRPVAALWSSIVLARIVRIWGTVTLLRQGWTTRQHGAELVLEPVPAPSPIAIRPADLVAYAENA